LFHGFCDVLPTFRHFYPDVEDFRFDSLLRQFAIPVNRMHDAKQVTSGGTS
jgi:hypothetical protein